jgi:hypothetical protein
VQKCFDRLFALERTSADLLELKLDEGAKLAFLEFENRIEGIKKIAPDSLRAMVSKMVDQCARLILIVHMTRWAPGSETTPRTAVGIEAVEAGIALADYFIDNARKLDGLMEQAPVEKLSEKLANWILRDPERSKKVTIRQILRSGVIGSARKDALMLVLEDMVESGRGRLEDKNFILNN